MNRDRIRDIANMLPVENGIPIPDEDIEELLVETSTPTQDKKNYMLDAGGWMVEKSKRI